MLLRILHASRQRKRTLDICRVLGAMATSPMYIHREVWLPDTWYGRVLTGGNDGLGPCNSSFFIHRYASDGAFGIQISNVQSSTMLPLSVAIGRNNGQDGSITPGHFLNPARIGSGIFFSMSGPRGCPSRKQYRLVALRRFSHHPYCNGCSVGGRQRISVASLSLMAFLSALPLSIGIGSSGLMASDLFRSRQYIPLLQWTAIVTPEILKQSDWLDDGRMGGIIAEPSLYSWNLETLWCKPGDKVTSCLTRGLTS